MGGTQHNIQALLQQGLLPFLAKKLGVNVPSRGAGGAQPNFAQPNQNPTISPARVPGVPQSSAQSAYSIKQDPKAAVGNFGAPTPQPISEIHGLQSLLLGWHSRKQQSQQAEAANAAQALLQAIEGAKQSGDWTPAYEILTK